MEQNTTPANSTAPRYWDGESALFMEDSKTGNVHILRPEGFDLDAWYEEQAAR